MSSDELEVVDPFRILNMQEPTISREKGSVITQDKNSPDKNSPDKQYDTS